ncbi:MAG TPA: cytochrome c3 family protein [Candidatus Limnocylindrales bacterium]|nr:cytochrome c3 family protein [Candidatus Limnocylindrales bacterium]
MINWTGWRKVSFSIKELSQSALMYITFADTVRIKLESNNELGASGTIFIDDLKKDAVGSHTQYDEVECGVCHAGRHNIKKAPQCQDCHQNQEHGWPTEDKYTGDNASCMGCHQADATQNLINISNISEHTSILESFEDPSLFLTDLTSYNQSGIYYNGITGDGGNHSAVLNYSRLTGYLGGMINVTDSYKYKGISAFVKASNDPGTKLVFGVYTTGWYNYSVPMDWDGWKEINIIYHNRTVNENTSFNSSGNPVRIWFGVYGSNSTGTVYFDDLRQAVSDDYHQYESWRCADCHIQIKNLHGITDITSPIVDCALCHDLNEPHYKQFTRVCMDCHFDSRHGELDDGKFTNYEKASTCLKCHTVPHDFNQTHLETAECNTCHQQRIHGQNYQNVQYNESLHLDCERCHGKTTEQAPLPMGLGSPRTTILRLSYTYNNETQCLNCHKNLITAYDLHANQTVNEIDQGIITRVLNNSICIDCHGAKSILNDIDRDELTEGDPDREPYAPQIEGHGNVSCYKCHGHRPETLTLNYGSNCVGCHQNMAELTALMPGMLNDSSRTNVTNPGEKVLIVHPPQVTGHGNASCSNCHGHVNSNLTYVGSSSHDCANCHRNTSTSYPLIPFREPDSIRSTVTNPGGNPLNVIAPQVLGHGNASCRECHDHTPSYFNGFDFTQGTVCESCHQNISKNVSLIENSRPDSNRTVIVDNSTSISIVHSPQVMGHGQTACSVCHSHSAERLVYHGGNNSDCILCHYNESSEFTLLQNGSYMISTQITPHLDLNCTVCHGHTPANMTRIKDCSLCHQNETMSRELSNKYGKGLNLTGSDNNISAVQISLLKHSTSNIAGRKWNKTSAYWNNNYEACQYCHTISKNFSSHNPIGRISVIAGNNSMNSSLSGSYWCAACHYQGYVSGNATYTGMANTFIEMGLGVPPEITGNASYGNYTVSNDGVKYYNHALLDYSDEECSRCHGKANNTMEFLHGVTVGVGGSGCLNCHEGRPTGPAEDPFRYPGILNSSFGNHKNLNTTNGPDVLDNYDCAACHYNTSEMDDPGWTTLTRTCNDCHIHGNYSASKIDNHRQDGVKISTNVYCSTCHGNSINEYNYSLNASVSHYGTNASLVTTVNQNPKPKFGFMTRGDAQQYNKECNNCHNPSNSSYGNATLITTGHIGRATCNECHVNGSASDLHNNSLGMPVTFNCKSCHTTYASKYGAPDLTGTPMAGYSSCGGSNCHIGNTADLDTLAKHNVDRIFAGTPGSTDTVYLNGQVSLTVTKGALVSVTSRVNDVRLFGGASRIGGAEYYIGTDPGQGKGIPMRAVDGSYDALLDAWENVNATIDTNNLANGNHTIFVRGVDIGKQWSAPKNATLVVQTFGYINGTVMNGTSAISGAIVFTNGASNTTDANGNYSLKVSSGTYNVTAGKQPTHNDKTINGVVVTQGNTTILPIDLQQKLTGTISGVVTKA